MSLVIIESIFDECGDLRSSERKSGDEELAKNALLSLETEIQRADSGLNIVYYSNMQSECMIKQISVLSNVPLQIFESKMAR